jgi:hypothetical protein
VRAGMRLEELQTINAYALGAIFLRVSPRPSAAKIAASRRRTGEGSAMHMPPGPV